MLQLCCCIEAHLKENTAYFQVRVRAPLSPVTRLQCPGRAPIAPDICVALTASPPGGWFQHLVPHPWLLGLCLPGVWARQPCVTLFLLPQFFSDVREAEEQLQKLQETLRRKYTCDRSITVTRLEDLLQDAQVRRM